MSMSDALRDPASALSVFLGNEFPDLKMACRETCAVLPRRPLASPEWHNGRPLQVRTIGTAFDHRLRIAFTFHGTPARTEPQKFYSPIAMGVQLAIEQKVAAARLAQRVTDEQAQRDARAYHQLARLGCELVEHFETVTARLQPHDPSQPFILDHDDEQDLCRLCYAGAWYDEFLRIQDLDEHRVLRCIAANEATSLDDLLGAAPREAIDDMVALLRLASTSDLAALRTQATKSTVLAAPRFTGGGDVGRADADLLVGDLLLEVKTTRRPLGQVEEHLRQLLAYLLLDYHDHYAITKLALYYARHGYLATWNVDELLRTAGAQRTLKELRTACAQKLNARKMVPRT